MSEERRASACVHEREEGQMPMRGSGAPHLVCPRARRLLGVDDLAVQVGGIDSVAIDECQVSHPRCGEVQRDRRAEASEADDSRTRGTESRLAGSADRGEHHLSAIPLHLRARQAVR